MVIHRRVSNPGVSTVLSLKGERRIRYFCFTTCPEYFYTWSFLQADPLYAASLILFKKFCRLLFRLL